LSNASRLLFGSFTPANIGVGNIQSAVFLVKPGIEKKIFKVFMDLSKITFRIINSP
jgi:hypothetical protein